VNDSWNITFCFLIYESGGCIVVIYLKSQVCVIMMPFTIILQWKVKSLIHANTISFWFFLITGITDDDLRETAYEVLLACAGASG
jgi:hypothetical protein